MKALFGVLLLLLISSSTVSGQYQEIHTKHFYKGYPAGTPASNDLIIRDLYALSNNDDTKFADWVAYRIDLKTMSGKDRPRDWKADPWLDESETLEYRIGSSIEDDYRNANARLKTDRGHQAPLASLDWNETYKETNYYSNVTPQKSDLNRGAWLDLENKVRHIIRGHNLSDHVFVYTGPLYEREMPKMPGGDENVAIPSGYWKIIIVPIKDGFQTASFVFDQDTKKDADIKDHIVSIDEVEKRSGLDFFWELKDVEENTLERSSNSTWVKRYF